MKFRRQLLRVVPAITSFALVAILGSAQSLAQNAYIANELSDNVTVIDTRTNTVVGSPTTVGNSPWGVAVAPDGVEVYVANINSGTVSVIDARTNTVTATFHAGSNPYGVAVSPDGSRLYVMNDLLPATVTVLDAATGATVATIPIASGNTAAGIAVLPDGSKVYAPLLCCNAAAAVIDPMTNAVIATIATPNTFNALQAAFSPDGARAYVPQTRFPPPGGEVTNPVLTVIDVATNAVIDTVVLGNTEGFVDAANGVVISPDGKKVYVINELYSGGPFFTSQLSIVDTATDAIIGTIAIPEGADAGISITPDGGKLYVVNTDANSVTVVDTATNTATAVIPVGAFPNSVGNFIQPAPKFAGTPGRPSCYGVSASALTRQYGGLNNAAAELGDPSVDALQNAIMEFCEG
jgi:YVTN family beta-propeller protein